MGWRRRQRVHHGYRRQRGNGYRRRRNCWHFGNHRRDLRRYSRCRDGLHDCPLRWEHQFGGQVQLGRGLLGLQRSSTSGNCGREGLRFLGLEWVNRRRVAGIFLLRLRGLGDRRPLESLAHQQSAATGSKRETPGLRRRKAALFRRRGGAGADAAACAASADRNPGSAQAPLLPGSQPVAYRGSIGSVRIPLHGWRSASCGRRVFPRPGIDANRRPQGKGNRSP